MLPAGLNRVLLTTDAVGGVWRYSFDLAENLAQQGCACLLAGFGPAPETVRLEALKKIPDVEVAWTGEALDWLTEDEGELDAGTRTLARLAADWNADLLHVNAPTQSAGLPAHLKVVVASHSCVPTWWNAVRGDDLPEAWSWQLRRNRDGIARADAVFSPSAAHANALHRAYGPIDGLRIVPNATSVSRAGPGLREPAVLAAGRWWDEGKGAAILDAAAAALRWPVLLAGALHSPHGRAVQILHARALGELPSADVAALMGQAAIFAAPSIYEPFGLAVLEAARRGCALVLSDIPVFRELWSGAAVFVLAHDPGEWGRALNALIDDPPLRASLAAAAQAAAERFTPGRQLAGLFEGYAHAFTAPCAAERAA